MKKLSKILAIMVIIIILATISVITIGCPSDGKVGYVRDYITSSTPTNLTGLMYGTGAVINAANLTGVVYANSKSAPTAATNTQLGTAVGITGLYYSSAGTAITAATKVQIATALASGNLTLDVLTLTGTPVIGNHACGIVSLTAGAANVSVSHGLSSTPTIIVLTFMGNPGTSTDATAINNIYWGSANGSVFFIYPVLSTNATVNISWLAFIADE